MKATKYIVFWLGLIVTVAFLYDVKQKVSHNVGATAVNIATSTHGAIGASFRKSDDGHFYILASINGENIRFLVDTGATDVVLSSRDAQKIGAHIRPVKQSKTYRTANGSIKASYLQIPEIRVGNLVARNVGASISTTDLETSLLGMSFLKNFQFIMKKNELVLYQD